MTGKTSKFLIGLFVMAGILLGVGIIVWIGASKYFQKGSTYVTFFDESVQGLQMDSSVKYRGVDVGRVERIRVAPDYKLVEVVMKVELEGDYDPGALPGFDKLRAQLLVRQSTDDQGAASTRYRSGLARMHMRPAGVLDLSLLAWGHRADDVSEGPVERLSSRGSGLLTATSTPLPGLSVYVRGEGDVTSTYADTADTPQSKDVSLDRSILASTVLRPGKAPVELEASYSRSLSDLLSDIDRRDGFSDWLQDVGDSADVRQQRSTVISGGPLLFLPSQSTLRLRAAQTTRTNADSSGVFSSTTQETYSLSLDLRPLTSSRWLAEGSGSVSRADGHESESWNTYARWERRWVCGSTPLALWSMRWRRWR